MVIEKKRALAEEIARVLEPHRQEDDEITVKEYAESAKCTRRIAYERLMRAVSEGQMTKRKVLVDRGWSWVFKMVRNEETDEKTDIDNRSNSIM